MINNFWPYVQQNCALSHGIKSEVKVRRDRLRWPKEPLIIFTFRHYKGGRSSTKRAGRLYLRRNPSYSLSEAESTSGHMVLSGIPRKKSPVTSPGIDPGTVRLVAQCLNHYATLGLILFVVFLCIYHLLHFLTSLHRIATNKLLAIDITTSPGIMACL
jgi:hypothetical protein